MDRARMSAIEQAVTEDLGGSDQISAAMSALIADFSFAIVLRDLLSAHLAATGPLTRAGRVKAAYTTWLAASQRVESLSRRIGTARVPARVPSLEEVMGGGRRQHDPLAGPASPDPAAVLRDRGPERHQDARRQSGRYQGIPGFADSSAAGGDDGSGIPAGALHPDEVAP